MEIEKPSVDKREYRHVSLTSTGKEDGDYGSMDVLLISDPSSDKASAACDVHVGQFCDASVNLPGLAHFCEHMLFIGTTKYPTENAYDQYLSSHGGSSNAFTDLEHTCYYFDVQAENLEGALDRFAQCFIGPLFTQSALEREVQAVDSEHAKNLQQDAWRLYQLSKSRVTDDSHPYSHFGSGNQTSLPIVGIREKLLQFYRNYYRRSLSMYKLVVLGKESLDDLEAMVHKYFDELIQSFQEEHASGPPKPRQELLKEWYPSVPNWQVPQRLHIVPVAQVHALEMQFPMPPILETYTNKPTRYLSHLLGHEGKGSLLSLLKAKHYVQELYADDNSKSCMTWSIFTIHMELTELGLEQVDEVVRMVFAYIDFLKTIGPQNWIQTELTTVADLQFRFLSQRNPFDYTCSLAGWMQLYPPHHYLSGPYKVYGWDPEAITKFLSSLHPDNVLLMISSPTYHGNQDDNEKQSSYCSQEEPWYGTKYESIPIDETLWNSWRTVQHTDYSDLKLPEVNDMIATEFDLLPCPSEIPKEEPQCILHSSQAKIQLWYKPDNVFEMPKVNLLFQLSSVETAVSPEPMVALQLFVELIQEHVNEFTYLASMAGLHQDVGLSSTGSLELHVTGYHHKAHVLVERIVDTMLEMVDGNLTAIDTETYERLVYKLEQHYQSFLVAQPYQHAIYGGDLCCETMMWTIPEKLAALKSITLQEVMQYAKRFTKHVQLEGLVHGNVTPQHAKDITQRIWNKLQKDTNVSSSSCSLSERRVVQMERNTSYLYRFAEFNPANTNSVLQILLQIGVLELKDNATLAFLHHLIREPAFNQLRTEEQLGYIVHTSVKTSGNNIKGLLFLIQSDAFDPIHVEMRVEEFISKFRERIVSMTEQDISKNVDAVVASLLEKVSHEILYLPLFMIALFACSYYS